VLRDVLLDEDTERAIYQLAERTSASPGQTLGRCLISGVRCVRRGDAQRPALPEALKPLTLKKLRIPAELVDAIRVVAFDRGLAWNDVLRGYVAIGLQRLRRMEERRAESRRRLDALLGGRTSRPDVGDMGTPGFREESEP